MVRWTFRDARLDSATLQRALPSARVVKDYRLKKTVEIDAAGRTWLVKIYKAVGALRTLKARVLGSKARHELRMYDGVVARGIPTVPLAAAGERGAEGYVVIEKLAGWRSLQDVLLDDATPPALRRRLLDEYGRFARRLHDAGVWQQDFNASNVLLDPARPADLRVIDFERMKLLRAVSEASRLKTLAKMNRIPKLTRADRMRFLRAYGFRDRARRILELGALQLERDVARFARHCVRENRNFGSFESGWYRKRRPDAPEVGVTLDEARALARGDLGGRRAEEHDRALDAWKLANAAAHAGGPVPVAVVLVRGGRGRVIFS